MGTRVLLVSHRPHLSAQIRLLIESRPGLVVVAESRNCARALAVAAVEKPAFIVVDLPARSRAALHRISDLAKATKHLLVLAESHGESLIGRVRAVGASVLRTPGQVPGAILALLEHRKEHSATLTPQELAVVELVARGLNDKKIAKVLLVSEAVVVQVLDSIFRKLQVQSRFELLIYSLYWGLTRLGAVLYCLDCVTDWSITD